MNSQGWRFFTRYEPWSDATTLFASYVDHLDRRHVVKPLDFALIERGTAYDMPTLGREDFAATEAPRDVRGFLQAAMEAAWDMGLRPQNFADHVNELTAVRYHLEDMRALAKVPPKRS